MKNVKLIVGNCVTIIGTIIGFIVGRNGSFLEVFIGVLIFGLGARAVSDLIMDAFFPDKMFEGVSKCYRIINNKLYYNINCNGKIEPHFITDVDEYNGKFMIENSYNCFPIVMVNGELKFFLLKNILYDYNFYSVMEIEIKEVLIEKSPVE